MSAAPAIVGVGESAVGSAYPNCGPLKEVRQIVDALGFVNQEIKQKYLQGNARRLPGLATN